MPLNPFVAGRELLASEFNDSVDAAIRTRYQTADQTRNNSSTFLASPDLVMPVAANALYTFESCILYDSSTTADFKHEWQLPAGSGISIATWTSTTSGNAVDSPIAHDVLSGFSFASGGAGIGTVMSCRPCGVIAIGATAGDLVIRFAQNTAAAVNTRLVLGSWIRLSRVV